MPSTQASSPGGLEWGSHKDFSFIFSRLILGHSNKPTVIAIDSLWWPVLIDFSLLLQLETINL